MKPLRLLLSLLLFLAFAPGAMATDAIVTLPDDSGNTGKKLDESQKQVNGNTVIDQRINICDPTSPSCGAVDPNQGVHVWGSVQAAPYARNPLATCNSAQRMLGRC